MAVAKPHGDWPIELRCLVSCLRAAIGTEDVAGVDWLDGEIDWEAWLRWVERHGVSGFLHHKLPEAARARLPPAVRSTLRDRSLRDVGRALATAGELRRLAARFAEQGIRVLGFKGPLLSRQLYGEMGVRHAGDIDLLVAPNDVAAADSLLRDAAYRRSYPDFEPTAFQWRRFLSVEHELNHIHSQSGMRVEVQWRLEGLPEIAFDDLWQSRLPVDLGGQTVATLPENVNSLFLFVHGAKHGWASIFWLLDAALVLRDCGPAKANALCEIAQRMAATRSLLQGATLARELLWMEPPPEFANHLKLRNDVRRLVAKATRRMSRLSVREDVKQDLLRNTVYLVQLQESWRARFQLVRRWLSSPQNWKEFPLPDRWFWLYYPASPLLWAWRRFTRHRQGDGGSPLQARPRNR